MTSNSDLSNSKSMSIVTKENHLMTSLARIQHLSYGLLAAVVALSICLGFATQAQAAPEEFGIESVNAELSSLQAGGHPDVITEISFKPSSAPEPHPESITV